VIEQRALAAARGVATDYGGACGAARFLPRQDAGRNRNAGGDLAGGRERLLSGWRSWGHLVVAGLLLNPVGSHCSPSASSTSQAW
jgi:hypothetical protein